MLDEETRQKIIKLLELSRNNPNENEAKSAKEKAENIMKENKITYADLFMQKAKSSSSTSSNAGYNPHTQKSTPSKNPGTEDFRVELRKRFAAAERQGLAELTIKSGDLHRDMGASNCMPTCCSAMRSVMNGKDIIIESPPLGNGSRLIIKYCLPR